MTDEDTSAPLSASLAIVVGLDFGAATLGQERTVLALVGQKAIVDAVGATGTVDFGGDLAVGTAELADFVQREITGAKAFAAFTIVNQAGHQLRLPLADAVDIGKNLGHAGRTAST